MLRAIILHDDTNKPLYMKFLYKLRSLVLPLFYYFKENEQIKAFKQLYMHTKFRYKHCVCI